MGTRLALFSMALLAVAVLTAACGGGDDGGGGPFGNAGGGPAPTTATNQDGDGGGGPSGSGTAGCVLRMTLSEGIEKEIDWDEDEVDCGGLGLPARAWTSASSTTRTIVRW